jgi:hypothetical protein
MKMNKKLALLIAAIMFASATSVQLANISCAEGIPGENLYKGKEQLKREREEREKAQQAQQAAQTSTDEYEPVSDEQIFGSEAELPLYYPNATMKSAVAKYKKHNYSGCIQELYSILKKDKENSLAYYYLAMAYIKAGKKDQAQAAYQKVINLNRNEVLVEYAQKGKACLSGDPSCTGAGNDENTDEMDKFISSPYGNGFSEEANTNWKKMQLKYLQNKINNGGTLTPQEVEKMKKLNKSETFSTNKLAFADNGSKKNSKTPSNGEILEALDVLKRAGLNISAETPSATETTAQTEVPVQTTAQPAQPQVQPAQNPMAYTPDPQIQQMSMMLNGGNNNNTDPMMYMLPYMMNANNGQNIDPKVIQSMMMNSMMNSLNSMNPVNNNN